MKKSVLFIFSVLAVFALGTSIANAITVDIHGTDYTTAVSSTKYDFVYPSSGSSDGGTNKINIVDYILRGSLNGGDHRYTLLNGNTVNPVETWFANGAVSVIINEIAGYANSNTFGYYTKSAQNPSINRTELFSGPEGKGEEEAFTFITPQTFGFYLGVPNTKNFYYTESLLNPLLNGSREIHAAIFQVDSSNTYILGFEDLRLACSDRDYQDMIVSVTINSVPEPTTMLLLGLGLVGLAGIRRKL